MNKQKKKTKELTRKTGIKVENEAVSESGAYHSSKKG